MINLHKLSYKILLILCCSLIGFKAIGSQGEPYDYYVPAPDRLLENVEKYHLQQGIDKVKQGKFDYAWSEFAFMLHYFPNHPRALQLISDLSLQMEQTNRAIKYFDRALRLYPNNSATYALYGVFLHKLEKYELAIEQYTKALYLDNSSAEYYYNLGLAQFALQQYEQSNISAQKAYQKGYPLPALKEKLIAKGAWKTLLNHG